MFYLISTLAKCKLCYLKRRIPMQIPYIQISGLTYRLFLYWALDFMKVCKDRDGSNKIFGFEWIKTFRASSSRRWALQLKSISFLITSKKCREIRQETLPVLIMDSMAKTPGKRDKIFCHFSHLSSCSGDNTNN